MSLMTLTGRFPFGVSLIPFSPIIDNISTMIFCIGLSLRSSSLSSRFIFIGYSISNGEYIIWSICNGMNPSKSFSGVLLKSFIRANNLFLESI